jgi:hypothetical protein
MKELKYYVPGGLIIIFSILIVAFPEILVALIAGFVLMMGVIALFLGHMMSRSELRIRQATHRSGEKHPNEWFSKQPLSRR